MPSDDRAERLGVTVENAPHIVTVGPVEFLFDVPGVQLRLLWEVSNQARDGAMERPRASILSVFPRKAEVPRQTPSAAMLSTSAFHSPACGSIEVSGPTSLKKNGPREVCTIAALIR